MKLYNNYLSTIESVLNKGKRRAITRPGTSTVQAGKKLKLTESVNFTPSEELVSLARLSGVKQYGAKQVGRHPDFIHLIGTDESEYHNITSTFVDIKGSTKLFKDYDNEQIFVVTNTIQNAAIHTTHVFGGHIQRLQYDGVFSYFGGKIVDDANALKFSLTSVSVFTYFVKNDLKRVFQMHGIDNVYTRVGIDIGDSHSDVLWGVSGTNECFELGTTSLHTSLAYKIQQLAKSNGIMVGENVKNKLPELSKYFLPFTEDKSIENEYSYMVYTFDWLSYLKSLPFVRANGLDELDFFENQNQISAQETERLSKLRESAFLIKSGDVFTDNKGIIGNQEGVKNQPHRFHFEEKDNEEK